MTWRVSTQFFGPDGGAYWRPLCDAHDVEAVRVLEDVFKHAGRPVRVEKDETPKWPLGGTVER